MLINATCANSSVFVVVQDNAAGWAAPVAWQQDNTGGAGMVTADPARATVRFMPDGRVKIAGGNRALAFLTGTTGRCA